VKNLDELAMVITAGKLRMSDDERLQAIDRIYASIEDQFSFLRDLTAALRICLCSGKVNRRIRYVKKILGY